MPYALYEVALSARAGVYLPEVFEKLAVKYAHDAEVGALLHALAQESVAGPVEGELPMVGPFRAYAAKHPELAYMPYMIQVAAYTGEVQQSFEDLGTALLLQARLKAQAPSAADIAVGKYLLHIYKPGAPFETILLTWSSDPSWTQITERGVVEFPDAWWDEIPQRESNHKLTLIGDIRNSLAASGTPERVEKIEMCWKRYASAWESL